MSAPQRKVLIAHPDAVAQADQIAAALPDQPEVRLRRCVDPSTAYVIDVEALMKLPDYFGVFPR